MYSWFKDLLYKKIIDNKSNNSNNNNNGDNRNGCWPVLRVLPRYKEHFFLIISLNSRFPIIVLIQQ